MASMSMWRSRSAAFVVLMTATTLMAGCADDDPASSAPAESASIPVAATVTFPDSSPPATLSVDIADDGAERARGLMGVTSLPDDEGMAFLYEGPTTERFWMRDTLIPLSIAFWDERGRVVAVEDMQPCPDGEPCPTYGAPSPYIGAVEANLGWFDEHGVEPGDRVDVTECCAS
jgi:uncharacterized membrane protein (UPF0127 family)